MNLRSSPPFKSCGRLYVHTQLQLVQELDEQIDLGLSRNQYRRENHAGNKEPAKNGRLNRLWPSGEKRRLNLRALLGTRAALPSTPFARKGELEEGWAMDLQSCFGFSHRGCSWKLRKTPKAYEEPPAILNVRHCEIFIHAEQLLNRESAAW